MHFSRRFLLGSLSQSSEVEHNPKMNILFFDNLGGLFCFLTFRSTFFAQIVWPIIRSWTYSKNKHFIFQWLRGHFSFFCVLVNVFCLDCLANHQKLNVIQKWTFYFSMTSVAFFGFLHFGQCFMLGSLGRSSEVERNPKMNIWFFNDLGGLFCFLCFGQCYWLRLLGWSSEVECNPKTNILFCDVLGGLFCFFVFWSTVLLGLLGRSSEVERNWKMNILFFDNLGGLFCFFAFWSTFFAQITLPFIRSWT